MKPNLPGCSCGSNGGLRSLPSRRSFSPRWVPQCCPDSCSHGLICQISELVWVYYFPGLFLNLEQLTAMVYSMASETAGLSQPRGCRLSSALRASTWGGQKLCKLVWLLVPTHMLHSDFSDRSIIVFHILWWEVPFLIVHPCSAFHYEGCWISCLL